MDDPWWPLTWRPQDAAFALTSIDFPTAMVTHKGKTVYVDEFRDTEFIVSLKRSNTVTPDQVELPYDLLVLRCFLQHYFEHAEEDEWPRGFWGRMQESNDGGA
jgi:hypothetical protein